jgi:hypothetical protein
MAPASLGGMMLTTANPLDTDGFSKPSSSLAGLRQRLFSQFTYEMFSPRQSTDTLLRSFGLSVHVTITNLILLSATVNHNSQHTQPGDIRDHKKKGDFEGFGLSVQSCEIAKVKCPRQEGLR